jgi:hypothetical protein
MHCSKSFHILGYVLQNTFKGQFVESSLIGA